MFQDLGNDINYYQSAGDLNMFPHMKDVKNTFNVPKHTEMLEKMVPGTAFGREHLIEVLNFAGILYRNRHGTDPPGLDKQCQVFLYTRLMTALREHITNSVTKNNPTFEMLNACCNYDTCPKKLFCEILLEASDQYFAL